MVEKVYPDYSDGGEEEWKRSKERCLMKMWKRGDFMNGLAAYEELKKPSEWKTVKKGRKKE